MIDTFRAIATTLGARARVVLARLRGVGTLGDPQNAEAVDDAEVLFPLGFLSRPRFSTATDETHDAIGIRDGDEVLVLAIRKKSAGLLTSAPVLEEGETRLHAAGQVQCVVRLRQDGSIEVVPLAGQNVILRTSSGGEVRFDGGAYADRSVGRVDDPCAKTAALGTWMGQVETMINGLAPGSVTPLSTTFTNVAVIANGAPNVKG